MIILYREALYHNIDGHSHTYLDLSHYSGFSIYCTFHMFPLITKQQAFDPY